MTTAVTTLRFEPDLSAVVSGFEDLVSQAQDLADPVANAFDGLTVAVENTFDTVKLDTQETFGKVRDIAGGAFDGVQEHLGSKLSEIASGAKAVFGQAFGEVGDVVQDQIKVGVSAGLEGIGLDPELASSIGRNFGQLAGTIGDGLTNKIGDAMGNLAPKMIEKLIATGLITAPVAEGEGVTLGGFLASGTILGFAALPVLLVAAAVAAVAFLVLNPEIAQKALDAGVGIVRGILEGLVSLAQRLVGAVTGAVGSIIALATELPGKAAAIGIEIVKQLINGIVGLVGGAISLGAQLVSKVINAVGGLIGAAVELPGKAAAIGISIVVGIINGVLGLFGGAVSLGKQLIDKVVDAVGGIVGGAVDLAKKAADTGSAIVKGLIDGMASLGRQLLDTVTGAVRSMLTTGINLGPFHIGLNGVSIDMPTIDIGDFHSGGSKDGKTAPGGAIGGSHADGLAFVPRDNYLANLHLGEMVLPAPAAAALRAGTGGPSLTLSGGFHLHVDGSSGDPYRTAQNLDDEWNRQFGFRLSELGG